jgi:cellulose 1,4-beta-cellobiosidase
MALGPRQAYKSQAATASAPQLSATLNSVRRQLHPRYPTLFVKMFPRAALLALSFIAVASAQQVGTLTAESHPKLQVSTVRKAGFFRWSLLKSHVVHQVWWLHDVAAVDRARRQLALAPLDLRLDQLLHRQHVEHGALPGRGHLREGERVVFTSLKTTGSSTFLQNCALDGADYSGTYGVSTSGNAATLKFVTKNSNGQNVGSRLYLMDSSDSKYQVAVHRSLTVKLC